MTTCPHFGSCGGCSRQDTPYEQQLRDKEHHVRTCLKELSVGEWKPILASPEQVFYRNKMEYSFGNEIDIEIFGGLGKPGAPIAVKERRATHIGLHPRKRFALVMPTPECQLLSEEGRAIQKVVTDWANHHHIASFTRKTAEGDLRHLVIREGKNTGERMVKLVAKSTTPQVDDLAFRLKASGIPITTFFWSVHDGLSDVAHGSENKIFWGDGTIQEKMGRVKVQVTPNSFLQTNTHAAELMLDVLRGWMQQGPPPQKVFDLYCGSGTIGLNLATDDMPLVGIETNSSAIEEARSTARENSFHNAEFIVGPVEKLIANHATLKANEDAIVVWIRRVRGFIRRWRKRWWGGRFRICFMFRAIRRVWRAIC